MGTRRQQWTRILDTLVSNGWRRTAIARDCDHWADEMWQITSIRPPIGTKAWLVFLVDPEWTGYRAKGEGVIAVAADSARRKEPAGWLIQIPLGRRWERGLAEMMEALQSTRAAKLQMAQEAKKQDEPAPPAPQSRKSRGGGSR